MTKNLKMKIKRIPHFLQNMKKNRQGNTFKQKDNSGDLNEITKQRRNSTGPLNNINDYFSCPLLILGGKRPLRASLSFPPSVSTYVSYNSSSLSLFNQKVVEEKARCIRFLFLYQYTYTIACQNFLYYRIKD